MRSFAPGFLEQHSISPRLDGILRELREYRGKEYEYRSLRPSDIGDVLVRAATVDSIRSSNRIEGLVIPNHKLWRLVGTWYRSSRSVSRDLDGFYSALRATWSDDFESGFSVHDIVYLHRCLDTSLPFRASPDDSFRWGDRVELEAPFGGSRVEWLELVPAAEARRTLEELHVRFAARRREAAIEPLLLVAAYVFDFVMIHPFRSGNGRLARLLTGPLLQMEGYEVGSYVSLDRIIEEQLQGYRDAFSESAPGWHHSLHDLVPWWEFLLGSVLLTAYRELEAWAHKTSAVSGYKEVVVEATIDHLLPDRFRVQDVLRAYSNVSRTTVNRALRSLRVAGRLDLERSGRGAIWAKR